MSRKSVTFFPNGNTIVFDENGEQMSNLQRSWIKLFADFLENHDENPEEFEFTLPNGMRAEVFETGNRFSWRIIP